MSDEQDRISNLLAGAILLLVLFSIAYFGVRLFYCVAPEFIRSEAGVQEDFEFPNRILMTEPLVFGPFLVLAICILFRALFSLKNA